MSWVAGFVDAVSWIVLLHVYTSHMTGNTASFGEAVSSGKMEDAVRHLWPIVPFLGGLLFSGASSAIARRRGFHSSFSVALATEIVFLAAFIAVGLHAKAEQHFFALISLPAAAMGMQTVTVTRINGLRVYTTYLTGSLSKFAESTVDYGLWFYDRIRARHVHRLRRVLGVTLHQESMQHALLTAGLWVGFAFGAVCGATLDRRFSLWALLAPILVMLVVVAIDIKWPVAAADDPLGTAG